MSNEIGKHNTPEEIELEAKRRELASLEEQVSERELELATIRAKLHHFEVTYLQEVGVYLTELDELKARIAEKLAAESPADETAQTEAKAAREQAAESYKATENLDEDVFRLHPDPAPQAEQDRRRSVEPPRRARTRRRRILGRRSVDLGVA